MSVEVKIVYADVETQLSDIHKSAESLDIKAEPLITGNTMDVITKLTELSIQLERLLGSYQTLLIKNCNTTKKSIAFMRESDRDISSAIHSTGDGARRLM